MTGALVLRQRFAIDDRTFAVLAEPWYDAAAASWRARLLFLPLDRSLPRSVMSDPVQRASGRDELLQRLARTTDRELVRIFRTIALPLPRRPRSRP